MTENKTTSLAAVFICSCCALLLLACGDNGGESAPVSGEETRAVAPVSPATAVTKETASTGKQQSSAGWQQVSFEEFTFSIPADWKRESGTDVWFPGTEDFSMGVPTTSMQCGVMPVMPGQTVEEQIREMIHGTATKNEVAVQKCNMNGHIREAHGDLSHLTLTLENPRGADMTAVYFFNCRVPVNQFSNYKEIYRRILDSVRCD